MLKSIQTRLADFAIGKIRDNAFADTEKILKGRLEVQADNLRTIRMAMRQAPTDEVYDRISDLYDHTDKEFEQMKNELKRLYAERIGGKI